MIKKNYITLFALISFFTSIPAKESTDTSDLSLTIINDIADITEDLASLIITCKHDKNPDAIKLLLVSLLKNIAKTSPHIKQIIETIKAKKQKRSPFETNIAEQLALEQLADSILLKVDAELL